MGRRLIELELRDGCWSREVEGRGLVEGSSAWGGERLDASRRVKPLQGERPVRAVANDPLETCSVLGLDPDRRKTGNPPKGIPFNAAE